MAWTEDQQKAIDETGTNIIVSAGAGSGKTAVLTARTMRIINSGVHVNELLILTFTKAAAGEMKERIRKSIKKGIKDNPNLKKELELIDQAYITTFDSFAFSVVKKYHYLLNIAKDIKISDASIIKLAQTKIMEEVFLDFYSRSNEEFENLINDFCVKDDNSLKNEILAIATKIDGLVDRREYLENYMDKFFAPEYIESLILEYKEIIKENVSNIKSARDNLSYYVDQDYMDKLDCQLSLLDDAETISDYINALVTIKMPRLPQGTDDEVKKVRDVLSNEISSLKNALSTYGTEDEIRNYVNKQKQYVNVIVSIIKEYLDRLHEYKEANNIYDFQDIALLSIRVLKENEFVRNELRDSFKEIMIDEYQDTNDIQETFIGMISNHNVYCVGDIKQSIYRFRNANPYIFKSKYDNYSLKKDGIKIDLVKNFRSRREVLANINEVFNLVMDNKIGGAEYHETHQMVYGNTSYIEEGKTDYDYDFKILEYDTDSKFSKEEIEIFTIAKDIKEKVDSKYQVFDKDEKVLRDITYNDFVILMDRTKDFDLYKKIFEYVGIPLTLYMDEKLNDSDEIYIIKNIVDYIIKIRNGEFDTKFKYDFVSIARSYLFNLSDEEIFKCFKNKDFKNNKVYETFKEFKDIDSISISDLLYRIIDCTDIYNKMIEVGNIDNSIIRIEKLLEMADNLSNLGYDIYSFSEYLNELLDSSYDMKYKVAGVSSDSVKIMTIHRSKGLEYHICYYSGLYREFNLMDLNDRFLFDNRYGIISPYFNEGIHDSFIKYLVKYHYIEEEISEKIRLFYVALTRTKESMILLTPKVDETNNQLMDNGTIDMGIRRKYRSFSHILNSIKSRINKYYHEIDILSLGIDRGYIYNNKGIDKISGDASDFEVSELEAIPSISKEDKHFSKASNDLISKDTYYNMKTGTKVHEIFEYMDLVNPDYSLIDDEFIRERVRTFIESELLKDVKNAIIYKEYEFMYQDDTNIYHGIIDLMLEYSDRIDIVDYKLNNIKDDKYLHQLNGYKNYIESISNKKVNIYLYSIISGKLEEL